MTTPLRMLFGGDMAPFDEGPVDDIAPSGSRSTITAGAHQAFPGLLFDDPLDLYVIYRYGTAHVSTGSEIDYRQSVDLGVSWAGGGTIVDVATGGNDDRDPFWLTLSTGDVLMGYSVYVPGTASSAAKVRIAPTVAGIPAASDTTLPGLTGALASFVSAPAIEPTPGTILLPGYGNNSGQNTRSVVWISSDGGDTWDSPVTIAYDAAKEFNETSLAKLSDGTLMALIREETTLHTWRSVSTNGGATWSAAADVNEMTGRPDFIEYRPGRLVQFGRAFPDGNGDSPGYYAVSRDAGLTWTTPLEIDTGETKLWAYSAPILYTTGVVKLVYALEASNTSSALYFRTLTDT